MSRIRVDPTDLRRASEGIRNAAEAVLAAGDDAIRAAQQVAGYEGQLGPPVNALAAELQAEAKAVADRLLERGEWLLQKAEAFEAADGQTLAGIEWVLRGIEEWVERGRHVWPFGLEFPSEEVNRLMRLANLLGDSSVSEDASGGRPWWTPIVLWGAGAWAAALAAAAGAERRWQAAEKAATRLIEEAKNHVGQETATPTAPIASLTPTPPGPTATATVVPPVKPIPTPEPSGTPTPETPARLHDAIAIQQQVERRQEAVRDKRLPRYLSSAVETGGVFIGVPPWHSPEKGGAGGPVVQGWAGVAKLVADFLNQALMPEATGRYLASQPPNVLASANYDIYRTGFKITDVTVTNDSGMPVKLYVHISTASGGRSTYGPVLNTGGDSTFDIEQVYSAGDQAGPIIPESDTATVDVWVMGFPPCPAGTNPCPVPMGTIPLTVYVPAVPTP